MKTFISTILLLLSINISAQEDALGVSLNVGTSQVTNTIFYNLDNLWYETLGLSGSAGIYYDHYFNENSLVEVDVLFSVLSSNHYYYDNSGIAYQTGEKIKSQLRYYYISIPVKYGYEHNDFIYSLGGYVAVNTSAFSSWDNPVTGERMTNEFPRYENLDYGVTIGIERILNNGMILGLNYSHGLANMIDSDEYHIKNRQLTFGIKYEFYRRMY